MITIAPPEKPRPLEAELALLPPLELVPSAEARAAAADLLLVGEEEQLKAERSRGERLNLYDVNKVLARVNRERAGME